MRVLSLVLAVLALAGGVFFAVRARQAERRAEAVERWTRTVLDSLASTVDFPVVPYGLTKSDSLYWAWTATVANLRSRGWQKALIEARAAQATHLNEYETMELRRAGFTDPERQLRDSLIAHPELIPVEPVHGGRMFFDPESIVLLGPDRAWASFEDGHVGGRMVLEYSVEPGRRVRWKPLWHERD
jgi:hypothetical protein